ncbi:MAG: hypothetical protein J7L04_04425 [Bacteroidales bacterium]|nr:hypothetical protein [Bacteroidales bacterium]
MKTLTMGILSIFLLTSCNNQASTNDADKATKNVKEIEQNQIVTGPDRNFTFQDDETGKLPSGWSQYFTGKGEKTDWKIQDDNGNKVLAQLSEENIGGHFNEIVYDGFEIKNVELNVRIKGIKGEMDQGGGFVWRFIDADNHYIVRANPLEDNVVLYKMENGKRTDLPLIGKGRTYGVDVEPLGNGWNDLKLTVVDNLFTVYLNNKEIFQVEDETFKEAGKVGLWTKADAVTYFDDFQVISIK